MSAASDIYDYFTPIEDAICTAFALVNIACYSPLGEQLLNAQADAATPDLKRSFIKKRPRVEIALMPGAALGRLLPIPGRRVASGHLPEQARRATLVVQVITEADIVIHRVYLAQVNYFLDTMAYRANQTGKMPNHYIGGLKNNGGSLEYKPEAGNFHSTLNYDVDFSVNTNAWNALNS
jgi:hypothetical protein